MMLLPSGHAINDQQHIHQHQHHQQQQQQQQQPQQCQSPKSNGSLLNDANDKQNKLIQNNSIKTSATETNTNGGATNLNTNGGGNNISNGTTGTNNWDVTRHIDVLQDALKDGWSVHIGKEGRLYYCNHLTRASGWLPPCENWGPNEELPYGWEKAVDSKGRSYFINHLNKTSTYEAPDYTRWHDDTPPEPRKVVLKRSTAMGFGFVAGSERPVIVRFVTEGGPSVNKLQPGDEILAVNDEDVKEAPRDHVIQLVRACDEHVTLLVCQPCRTATAFTGRKSTILSAGKRAKLKSRPSRVRFAESVCVNGSPLFPPSAFSLGDLCVPPMANVLKVFLENGQTKSFKYDTTTTVQDVVTSLRDKLCLNASEHFSLVLEHVKSLKRNKLTLLDPEETLARIAARPGAHKLRCLFRVTFVPVSAADLAQKDLNALDYLYMQCCNDVTQERFAPELQPDVALRLAALHMHQHALANNVSPTKLTVKIVEREFGLERFVPTSLIEGMKRKELRRLISHFLKLNSQMTGSSTKMLTQLQAKIHYLDIISTLPSYGAKCFSTNQREGVERVLLISPRFGLSQIAGVRNSVPQPISILEEISRVVVHREDDITCSVHVQLQNERVIKFSMEDRDAVEFSLVLVGYHRLLAGKELPVDREREKYDDIDNSPSYLSQHTVFPAKWSYLLPYHNAAHSINFLVPPPYHNLQETSTEKSDENSSGHINICDRNMNPSISNNNSHYKNNELYNMSTYRINGDGGAGCQSSDEFGLDMHSVMAMELLEEAAKDCSSLSGGSSSSGGGGSTYGNSFLKAKNQEVLRRVAEMQKMVESSEQYLNEHGELIHEYELKSGLKQPWNSTSLELDSDCDSLNSSKVSSNEDAPAPGQLKHSDSLVLLTETINQDLSGITQGLKSICTRNGNRSNSEIQSSSAASSQQATPKPHRKVNGLSQLLSDLQALGNDCSQSESDSESVPSPTNNKKNVGFNSNQQSNGKKIPAIRTSFGLHSPDSSVFMGPDAKDNNLKEYLRQLKEFSKADVKCQDHTDLAAQKLSELYGFDICGDALIETDADMIDLRAIPPPQTPDELDAPFSIINAAPRGFGDGSGNKSEDEGDLDKFLAKVIVAPPTQRATAAKELTPEEIMSFIIPPPPNLNDLEKRKSLELQLNQKKNQTENDNKEVDQYNNSKENLYSNSSNIRSYGNSNSRVIEYATVQRKGAFSCCSKSKEDSPSSPLNKLEINENNELELPPRRCTHIVNSSPPPARPPKKIEVKHKPTNSPVKRITFDLQKTETYSSINNGLPILPPRESLSPTKTPNGVPPKKPPLPPIAVKPILRNPHPLPKQILTNAAPSSPMKVAGIGSPHFHRNLNIYREIDNAFSSSSSATSSPSPITSNSSGISGQSPLPLPRSNGHLRSSSDCPATTLKNPQIDNKPQLSLLCSPQMSRKILTGPGSPHMKIENQPVGTLTRNGFVVNGEALMAKTDIAMAGLLVKLDQIAAQCTVAQAAGGGAEIDEDKFQRAREELTEQTLQLVTASKLLVVAMSDPKLSSLPEHLTSCLSALRRITELTQDMTKHTSSPLQTRNIVLKVHDVASSFRELAGVQTGTIGAGQLALQAECLAGVLTTLLRSLRIFSP